MAVSAESLLDRLLLLGKFRSQFLLKISDVLTESFLPELEDRGFLEVSRVSFQLLLIKIFLGLFENRSHRGTIVAYRFVDSSLTLVLADVGPRILDVRQSTRIYRISVRVSELQQHFSSDKFSV